MPRAVVFDLDYTLAVPTRDRATLLSEATTVADAPSLSREEYLAAHRRNLTRETREPIFADLLAELETDADPAAVADAYRETIADALEPLPGVESMLADLRGEYRVGLLTNGPVRAQRDKLATLGWEDAFDAALVTGELEAGKPDPRAFEAIAAELNVDPRDAVYVGDEVEADVSGATDAGMDAIQVLLEDGPDRDPRAVAHVEQASIATELPTILSDLA
ncbi:HAD-superfamily hydrolase, subfamily IA, variant 1 [Haloterrigena turkmenica DSM 5511]|uniref:HAD-superfamily hydrolase, subfamily IA, variant 1 n=1 Tax=Haloterrigena turkmenica (strain ATCC 51198 / DSM 5511 / JCM 9101 / NCIMB 13204 / VKM B-1734 / 4k) TaxID=543526 RepID=D2RTW8_HALTV|nr:HAD family hydrolase [Haloterrigena turkmenica]ADB61069.1 HAD-superfamily hydrolase, subfamily IA, variant 1 [Haloterrigena turkmenica DSM 5511]